MLCGHGCGRCAVNATPQKMSAAAGQLESFMKDVAGNRRSHKTTTPHIVEVGPPD